MPQKKEINILGDSPSLSPTISHQRATTFSAKNIKDPLKYKTELCTKFMTKGKCRYKKFCQYAHGREELKPKAVGTSYKTKDCDNFFNKGMCSYGSRCLFRHQPLENCLMSRPAWGLFVINRKLEKELETMEDETSNSLQQTLEPKCSRFINLFRKN